MLVDFSHRAETRAYPPQAYRSLAESVCNHLAKLPFTDAVILCGSLIKDTLVSGWSDLDIIVFCNDTSPRTKTLADVQAHIRLAQRSVRIGIGVDVVFSSDFAASKRLGGRPLAMTFEVAGYGQLISGTWPFASLPMSEEILSAIEYDRVQAIRAELHNWRRAFIKEESDSPCSTDWLARCVKTALKLLKYETDPNFDGPYTYDEALARAKSSALLPNQVVQIFQMAVEARKSWMKVVNDVAACADASAVLTQALSSYPDPAVR